MKSKLFVAFILISSFLSGQNTVGLLEIDTAQIYSGYNLIFPHNQPNVYLLNNCGEIVNVWTDSTTWRPGNGVYIDQEGNLIKCKSRGAASNPYIHAGGGGEIVEIRDWDNNLVWEYSLNDSTQRLHHDVAPMPNGNILMIVWEAMTEAEALQAGRDTALLSSAGIWPEKIVEVEPILGTDQGNIVWEWHAKDHLIQDYDETKDNYGVVADNPGLINFNYHLTGDNPDWLHANSIDFNPELNQVLLSVPTFSEIWIIDHSTTTEQAAGHSGGLSNRGGDLMYRYGNPAAYDRGDADDQRFFYQHDAQWTNFGLSITHPDYGKLSAFNNRAGSDFSSAVILDSNWDMYKWIYPKSGGFWPSGEFDWEYTDPIPQNMYSNILSSVQRLENGNTLICVGRFEYAFELNANNEKVWEYQVPLVSGSPISQGETVEMNDNFLFRMKRYASDYVGFDGKDLSPMGYIELNPNTALCPLISGISELDDDSNISIYPNPFSDVIHISTDHSKPIGLVEIYDANGRLLITRDIQNSTFTFQTDHWSDGLYFLILNGSQFRKLSLVR